MKNWIHIALAGALAVSLSACMTMAGATGEPDPADGVFNGVMLQPRAPLPLTRKQFKGNLNVVLEPPIAETFVMTRVGGKVTVKFANFRAALGQTLKDTFTSNFKSVSLSNVEAKSGLELIVTHVQDNPEKQGFDWRASFLEDGKVVTDLWGTMLPSQAVARGSTIYTWKRDTKDVTVELTNQQITDLATYIAQTLLQDEKMAPFWAKYL